MSAIHYKFSSSNEYKNVTFDGLHISLLDLKKAIMEKQKLKNTESDLHITNAQTLQVYKDESMLIPKNTAVLVRRIPIGPIRDSKVYVVKRKDPAISTSSVSTVSYQENESSPKLTLDELTKTSNLAKANASESDKIKAAIAQSTLEYDPKKFAKPVRYGAYKNSTNSSIPSSQIRCYRCNQQGHYSGQCPLPKTEMQKQYHPATGIPRSHMIEVSKDSKGAMLTSDGKYVVPVMDKKGYEIGKKERPPFIPIPITTTTNQDDDEEEPIPDELICLLCKDLLVDAVVIPCCGNSYCDECIRNALLESESHQCPTCHKTNISPDALIANKFLRQAVNKFRNDTGIKRSNAPVWPRPVPTEISAPKPSQPVKYGPPRSINLTEQKIPGSGYKVKARTDQVVASSIYLPKRAKEIGGSSSPRDPNQPIRIKLAKSDKSELDSVQSTPSEPKMQSTPVENNLSMPASSSSDSYTFNSTPDSNEPKPKVNVIEPLPPGLSPPTAKVVRSLETTNKEAIDAPPMMQLSGIEPLGDDQKAKNSVLENDTKESEITPNPDDSRSADETSASQPAKENGVSAVALENVDNVVNTIDILATQPEQDQSTPSIENADANSSDTLQRMTLPPPGEEMQPVNQTSELDLNAFEVPTSDVELVSHPVVSQPRVTSTIPSLPPSTSMHLNIINTMASINRSIPSVGVAPVPQPTTSIPPPMSLLIQGLIPGIPPPVSRTTNPSIFQQPPPPFPHIFPSLPLPPGQFTQPPPGFPPHTGVLPPPQAGLTIQSLAKTSSSASLPPPPGLETTTIPTINSSDHHSSRRDRYSPHRSERSPKKRADRREKKSKLDIMSDEFAENLQRRTMRRRRNKSRSRSYSTGSSYSASSSYSSSTSGSYSSSRSWSSTSYSRSRSRSPRKKHRQKRTKQQRGKERRKRSTSWSDRSGSRDRSRNRRSYSGRKEGRKRKERSSPRRKKREDRNSSRSPRRRAIRSSRGRSRSPYRSRRPPSPRRKRVASPSHPTLSAVNKIETLTPRLPTKEEADYERDRALYAHFKQAYKKDWCEKGVRPPSPYNRFTGFAMSPSPPPVAQQPLLPPHQINFSQFPPPPMHIPPPQFVDLHLGIPPPLGLINQQLPPWDTNLFGAPRPDLPQRELQVSAPSYMDQQRHFPSDYNPKEEQYSIQLSPRSRRYDFDRQSRENRVQHRDNRYAGNQRRNYDDYHNRKRARDYPRDLSPSRGSFNRNKRTRQSPVNTPDEGDATPVRDERPPPDEPAEKRPVVTRRAGDLTKVGKKPRRDKKSESIDRSKQRRSISPTRKDSKSSRSSRSESSSKTDRYGKRKTNSSRDKASRSSRDKVSQSSRTSKTDSSRDSSKKSKDSDSSKSKKVSDSKVNAKHNESDQNERLPEKVKDSNSDRTAEEEKEAVSVEEKTETEKIENKKSEEKSDKPAVVQEASDTEKKVEKKVQDKVVEKKKKKVESSTCSEVSTKKGEKEKQKTSKTTRPPKIMAEKPDTDPNSPICADAKKSKEENEKVDDKPPSEPSFAAPSKPIKVDDDEAKTEKPTKVDDEAKTEKLPQNEKKKEKSSKVVKLNRDKLKQPIKTDSVNKQSSKTKKLPTAKIASSAKSDSASKKSDSSSSGRAHKLVEYDGTGPPPAGNELVKITIPKSKWEESDDEGRETKPSLNEAAVQSSGKAVESDPKPSKGRRIRFKRKSPPKTTADSSKTSQASPDSSTMQSAVKKVDSAAKESISDARMVITLRRNSRHNEEKERRVSLGTADEARFEPDYSDDATSPGSRSPAKVPAKRGPQRTTSKDSKSQDDPDALGLSDYSNFSNEESEKLKKHSKKKKKKKKKRKLRSQISDNIEDDSKKKSSRSHDEKSSRSYDSFSDEREISEYEDRSQKRNANHDRKRHRRGSSADERSHKKEAKKKRRNESRDRPERDNYDSKSRDKDRFRDERREDRHERSHERRRKKEKRQKRHRRRGSSSEYSDVELEV